MVVRIETLNRDTISTVTSTTDTFLPANIEEVLSQTGASTETALIQFTEMMSGSPYTGTGVVAVHMDGHVMMADHHKVAKPCPPFCPKKLSARAEPYPS
jgi:hypothetical protein